MSNQEIAARLGEVADLLELNPQENPFRIAAYRNAADLLRQLRTPVPEILEREGREGLERLPGIGPGLAGSIEELLRTEHLGLLDRLREREGPEAVFETLPGVGPELAKRIHRELHVETLPELEQALYEGRLRSVPGIGPTLERNIREALQVRLRWARPPAPERPSTEELLDVDREYREKAAAGRLRRIAPRRFNPNDREWLPVLHTHRGKLGYTALYSNTPLAHELGKTRDWVVLYYGEPGHPEHQVTVVTETQGPLKGQRVVRGRPQLRSLDESQAPRIDTAPEGGIDERDRRRRAGAMAA